MFLCPAEFLCVAGHSYFLPDPHVLHTHFAGWITMAEIFGSSRLAVHLSGWGHITSVHSAIAQWHPVPWVPGGSGIHEPSQPVAPQLVRSAVYLCQLYDFPTNQGATCWPQFWCMWTISPSRAYATSMIFTPQWLEQEPFVSLPFGKLSILRGFKYDISLDGFWTWLSQCGGDVYMFSGTLHRHSSQQTVPGTLQSNHSRQGFSMILYRSSAYKFHREITNYWISNFWF